MSEEYQLPPRVLKASTLVTIMAKGHPHRFCSGHLTGEIIEDTGQRIIELTRCEHGIKSCGAMPGEYAQ